MKAGHSFEVDIWALGVITYFMFVGKPPFYTPDEAGTYRKIRNCSFEFPHNITIPDEAKNLMKIIFKLNPSERPTLEQILSHPFLNPPGATIPRSLEGTSVPKFLEVGGELEEGTKTKSLQIIFNGLYVLDNIEEWLQEERNSKAQKSQPVMRVIEFNRASH